MIVAVSNGSGVNFDRGPYFVFTRTIKASLVLSAFVLFVQK